MKHLIIYSHPNPESFNNAVKEIFVNKLQEEGQEVRIRELYKIGFDPLLKGSDFEIFKKGLVPEDVKQEQGHIQWADVIIFIFPIWWFQMPAMLKGYVDRVFSRGFAYDFSDEGPKGLLVDKKVVIINTTGGTKEVYEEMGFKDALKKIHEIGVFGICGMEVIYHKFFHAVPFVTDKDRNKMIEDFKTEALKMVSSDC